MALKGRVVPFKAHGEWPTTPKATMSPTVRDIAWAAGFVEGEGCFTHTGSAERVQANQVNPEPLLRLQAMFGGRLTSRHNNRGFGLFGTPAQMLHCWTINSARARGVALTLFPLMSARRKEQITTMLKRYRRQRNRKASTRRVVPSL